MDSIPTKAYKCKYHKVDFEENSKPPDSSIRDHETMNIRKIAEHEIGHHYNLAEAREEAESHQKSGERAAHPQQHYDVVCCETVLLFLENAVYN